MFGHRNSVPLQTLCSLQKHPPIYDNKKKQMTPGKKEPLHPSWRNIKSRSFLANTQLPTGMSMYLPAKGFKEAGWYDPKCFQGTLWGSPEVIKQPQGWLWIDNWGQGEETPFLQHLLCWPSKRICSATKAVPQDDNGWACRFLPDLLLNRPAGKQCKHKAS